MITRQKKGLLNGYRLKNVIGVYGYLSFFIITPVLINHLVFVKFVPGLPDIVHQVEIIIPIKKLGGQ